MNTPFIGSSYFFAGLHLIFQPGVRRFIILPVLINLLLFVGLFFVASYYVGEFNAWFLTYLPTWLQWLSSILWLIFFVGFFLFFIYTFVTLANLFAAPFNSLLAEKVEQYLTGNLPEARSLFDNIKDTPRMIGRQFAIIIYYLPRALCILFLFFIPFLQTAAPFIWFLFNAWFMTLTHIDYPTDNHRIPLPEVRLWLKQKRFISWGFGITVLVATMIPFFNLLALPAAVAGATQFWAKESRTN